MAGNFGFIGPSSTTANGVAFFEQSTSTWSVLGSGTSVGVSGTGSIVRSAVFSGNGATVLVGGQYTIFPFIA